MGDFVIDFRKEQQSGHKEACDLLKFYDEICVYTFHGKNFRICVTRPDDASVWSPFKSLDEKIFVGLAGRIALDPMEWESAKQNQGTGGLACRAIFRKYEAGGIEALFGLNGNFVVILYDSAIKKVYILTDRCGMLPCFKAETNQRELVVSSHPDVLSEICGMNDELDLASLAEFIVTGRLSYPYTYYKRVRALDYASLHTFDTSGEAATYEGARAYFTFDYKPDPGASEWELAEELGAAFRKAMRRRSLGLFGQTAVCLSGGLDSRAILCSIENKEHTCSICFYDEENLEYRIAREVAKSVGVDIIPFKREFDHYGNSAEMGVRISGGMDHIGNNHFLGFRSQLVRMGMTNLIAGFHCDYLFKGLTLNKSTNKFTRMESLADFRYENYTPFFWLENFTGEVRARLDKTFPDELKCDSTEKALFEIEQRRLFPLCYLPDNQQTLVPQRVLGWYLPTIDSDIIDVYVKIPPHYKLNTHMYSKMVELQCGKKLSAITNINTGARVNACRTSIVIHGIRMSIQRRLESTRNKVATSDSWPNWNYYLHNSKKIKSLWSRESGTAREVLTEILGYNPLIKLPTEYVGRELVLFFRLLTTKIWLEKRVSSDLPRESN